MTDRTLTAELLAALEEWGVDTSGADPQDFILISSSALDSLDLFQLSVWIEEKVGSAIDPAAFDLQAEWETPARIVRFIEKARRDHRTQA